MLAACPEGPLRVLDLASGTGLSAQGLAPRASLLVACDIARAMLRANHAEAKVLARAEALPFRGATFDLVACAQAFHWMEPSATYREMHRVLRPRGLAAVWWKYEAAEDPTAKAADAVVSRVLRAPAPHTDMAREAVLPGIADSPFHEAEEVRIRHAVPFTVESYVGHHASRELLRRAAGPSRDEVLEQLRAALADLHGSRPFQVAYLDRLCLLRKR